MLKKDIDFKKGIAIAALFVIIRLWLAHSQMVYAVPKSAPIDDDLYFRWAQSIVAGNWLGEYDYLTLSKYPFFAVYLAAMHKLNIPYLIGNCLSWIVVAALSVWALKPAVKTNYGRLLLFLALIYNPSTWARYTLRVYRDSLFPMLCTLFFTALTGWALRLKKDVRFNIGFLALAGIALGCAFIGREDGYWLFPFYAAAVVICIVYIFTDKKLKNKAMRIASMAVPAVFTAVFALTICSINNKYYGVFKITDFNSGAFARCYGAMTRLPHREWHPLVAVPKDVRRLIYDECEGAQELEYWMEESGIRVAYGSSRVDGDYQSGSCYWALRRSAQEMGVYTDPQSAAQFWDTLAGQVEALCDKYPDSLPPRASVTPPIKPYYILPTVETAVETVKYIFAWEDMQPYEYQLSDVTTGQLDIWEEFLRTKTNYAAIEYRRDPYHSPSQSLRYSIMQKITWLYRALILSMFIVALIGIVRNFFRFRYLSFERQIMNFVLPGLVAMAIFRIFIISFMEVAAFSIGIYSMYVGVVYPLTVIVAFFAPSLWHKEN